MKKTLLILFIPLFLAAAGTKDENCSVKLSVEQSNLFKGDFHSVGVGFEFDNEKPISPPKTATFGGYGISRNNKQFCHLKGAVLADAKANHDPITFSVGIDTNFNVSEETSGAAPGPVAIDPDDIDNIKPVIPEQYGMVTFGLSGGFETDQQFENPYFNLSGLLGYVYANNKEGAMMLLPDLLFTLSRQFATKQDLDDMTRWQAEMVWKMALGNIEALDIGFFRRSTLTVRYVHSDRIDAPDNADSADYASIHWLYDVAPLSSPWLAWIDEVYVKVDTGRLYPIPEDDTTLTLGVYVQRF